MDPYLLARFRDAQAGAFARARDELLAGAKRSHWMWFIFPQLRELGRSETARFYGLASLAEAEAYLADPVLGPRLIEMCGIVAASPAPSARALLGSPDDLKLRSLRDAVRRARPSAAGVSSGSGPLFRGRGGRADAGDFARTGRPTMKSGSLQRAS